MAASLAPAARRGEQLIQRQGETRENVAAIDDVLDSRFLVRADIDIDRFPLRIDEPDLLRAAAKEITNLAVHLGPGVSLADNFDGEVGRQNRNGIVRDAV